VTLAPELRPEAAVEREPETPPEGPSIGWLLRRFLEGLPTLVAFVLDRETGGAHGIGRLAKLRLAWRFRRNARRVEMLTSWHEQLELAAAILRVRPAVAGDVVECGCYLGGCSVNLSLVCRMVGRRLVICDSFEGLPEPAPYDVAHASPHAAHTDVYYKGRFAASLEAVRANIERAGALEVCDFVVGFYDESLRDFDRDVVVGFLDVDLIDSLKPCLRALWPRLADGCRLYVHEARSLSFVAIFFDPHWWEDELGCAAPGLVGAGAGLPLAALTGSELGYAQKGLAAVASASA
jgi:Macrocin-O-methyltransferase (TylF)